MFHWLTCVLSRALPGDALQMRALPKTVADLATPFTDHGRIKVEQKNREMLLRSAMMHNALYSGAAAEPMSERIGSVPRMQTESSPMLLSRDAADAAKPDGIYCRAWVHWDRDGNFIQEPREAHYMIYCGVIDILQSYGARKQAEALFKSFAMDQGGVSVSPPPFYRRRFEYFMTEYVFKIDYSMGPWEFNHEEVDRLRRRDGGAVTQSLRGSPFARGLAAGSRNDTSTGLTETVSQLAEPKPKLEYDPPELARQRAWKRVMGLMQDGPKMQEGSRMQLESQRYQAGTLLHTFAEPRTKLKNWRMKENADGVSTPYYTNVSSEDLCYNIALGVHYLLEVRGARSAPRPPCARIFRRGVRCSDGEQPGGRGWKAPVLLQHRDPHARGRGARAGALDPLPLSP
jgi:hypothetical protein